MFCYYLCESNQSTKTHKLKTEKQKNRKTDKQKNRKTENKTIMPMHSFHESQTTTKLWDTILSFSDTQCRTQGHWGEKLPEFTFSVFQLMEDFLDWHLARQKVVEFRSRMLLYMDQEAQKYGSWNDDLQDYANTLFKMMEEFLTECGVTKDPSDGGCIVSQCHGVEYMACDEHTTVPDVAEAPSETAIGQSAIPSEQWRHDPCYECACVQSGKVNLVVTDTPEELMHDHRNGEWCPCEGMKKKWIYLFEPTPFAQGYQKGVEDSKQAHTDEIEKIRSQWNDTCEQLLALKYAQEYSRISIKKDKDITANKHQHTMSVMFDDLQVEKELVQNLADENETLKQKLAEQDKAIDHWVSYMNQSTQPSEIEEYIDQHIP